MSNEFEKIIKGIAEKNKARELERIKTEIKDMEALSSGKVVKKTIYYNENGQTKVGTVSYKKREFV